MPGVTPEGPGGGMLGPPIPRNSPKSGRNGKKKEEEPMRMLTPGGESQQEGWLALTEDEDLQVQPPFPCTARVWIEPKCQPLEYPWTWMGEEWETQTGGYWGKLGPNASHGSSRIEWDEVPSHGSPGTTTPEQAPLFPRIT